MPKKENSKPEFEVGQTVYYSLNDVYGVPHIFQAVVVDVMSYDIYGNFYYVKGDEGEYKYAEDTLYSRLSDLLKREYKRMGDHINILKCRRREFKKLMSAESLTR